jgi:uncharacterized repeat protein (TIGR01451 family)
LSSSRSSFWRRRSVLGTAGESASAIGPSVAQHCYRYNFVVNKVAAAIMLACAVFSSLNVSAQTASTPASGLVIETLAERRVQAGGASEYVRANELRIGDEIFYTLRVRNASNNAIQEAVVVKSMPRNTRYVEDSATGPGAVIDFSVDGGATFAANDQLTVRTVGGGTRPATTDDYTDIRWRLRHPLAAGATALLRFRAIFK